MSNALLTRVPEGVPEGPLATPPEDLLAPRANPFARMRLQLPGGLVAAIGLPMLVSDLTGLSPDPWSHVTGAKLIGLFAGFVAFRKMTAYRTGNSLLIALGTFGAAYLAAALFVLAQGLQIFTPMYVMSLTLVVAWFWGVGRISARTGPGAYLLAPGANGADLARLVPAALIEVSRPSHADRLLGLPIVADPASPNLGRDWLHYLKEAKVAGREVITPARLIELNAGRLKLSHASEEPMARAEADTLYLLAKRYFDVALAVGALVLLWPLLLIVALAIRAGSPGPALFRQERMGFRGQPFTLWKFRSMRERPAGAGSLNEDMTQTDDQRITWIGKFIRKFRIDELPQIWNILKGDMSWIGPRPETLSLSAHYQDVIPHYRYRHVVRPGITGWAQVRQGHVVSVSDVSTKLEYDFFYVRHVSIWLDFLILILTLRVVLTGQGAK